MLLVSVSSDAMLNGEPFNKYEVALMLPLSVKLPLLFNTNLSVSVPETDDIIFKLS